MHPMLIMLCFTSKSILTLPSAQLNHACNKTIDIYIDVNTCEIEGTSPSLMSRHFHVGPLERIPDIFYLLIQKDIPLVLLADYADDN